MATIVFWPHPEPGHIFPTLRLARSLRRRGHRVVYLTIKDHEALIRDQTFECVVLFEAIMPLGWVEQIQQLPVDQQLRKYHWSLAREHRAILDGSVAAVVGALAPDVLLVDYYNENMDFVAYKLGIPFIHLFTSKVRIPAASVVERRWERVVKYVRRVGNLIKGWELRPRNWRTELGRYAGCPEHLVDRNRVPAGTRGIAGAPELALWLPELLDDDAPDATGVPGRCHAASVDVERTETGTVPWDDLRGDGPLVYFSLGSQSQRFDSEPIYRALLGVLETRRDLRAVIHLPRRLSVAAPDLDHVVIVKDSVPQLQVLQRASAFITHGGLGSVKEAVHHGVPMLIIPMSTDQPANAARIERLGLGRSIAPHEVTTETLAALLRDVLALRQTPPFTSTIARLRALEQGDHGAEFVESIVKHGAGPGSRGGPSWDHLGGRGSRSARIAPT